MTEPADGKRASIVAEKINMTEPVRIGLMIVVAGLMLGLASCVSTGCEWVSCMKPDDACRTFDGRC